MGLPHAGEHTTRGGCGELADATRAKDAHDRAEGEVVPGRRDAGEGAEEPVGLLLVGGDGGEEEPLAGPGRGEGGEAEGEVVHPTDGLVALAPMVAQRGGQWPAAAQPRDASHLSAAVAQR